VREHAPRSDGRGIDWLALATDQCTLFYSCEGGRIQRWDVCARRQLPDFASLPGSGLAFAIRLLPPGDGSGGLLVADNADVKRLDGRGAVVQTYDVAGQPYWFALALDPDGTSFWSGGSNGGSLYRFDLATGAVLAGPIT